MLHTMASSKKCIVWFFTMGPYGWRMTLSGIHESHLLNVYVLACKLNHKGDVYLALCDNVNNRERGRVGVITGELLLAAITAPTQTRYTTGHLSNISHREGTMCNTTRIH